MAYGGAANPIVIASDDDDFDDRHSMWYHSAITFLIRELVIEDPGAAVEMEITAVVNLVVPQGLADDGEEHTLQMSVVITEDRLADQETMVELFLEGQGISKKAVTSRAEHTFLSDVIVPVIPTLERDPKYAAVRSDDDVLKVTTGTMEHAITHEMFASLMAFLAQ